MVQIKTTFKLLSKKIQGKRIKNIILINIKKISLLMFIEICKPAKRDKSNDGMNTKHGENETVPVKTGRMVSLVKHETEFKFDILKNNTNGI